MSNSKEIGALKRRRRLRTLALLALAVGLYWGWRQWERRSWKAQLAASLPARLVERKADYADFLVRCESALLEAGLSESATPALPETIGGLLAENLAEDALVDRIEEIRRHLREAVGQSIFKTRPPEERFTVRLLNAPTYFVTEYEDSFHGQGGWEFLRHLPDVRGSTLFFFPREGYREAILLGEAPLRDWLETYDRVISVDVAPPHGEGLCARAPPAWQSARQAISLLGQAEAAAGGPTRILALRSEGQEAGLLAALIEPRVGHIHLTGPQGTPAQEERLAFLLALLGDRQILIDAGTLSEPALARLRTVLGLLGRESALTRE